MAYIDCLNIRLTEKQIKCLPEYRRRVVKSKLFTGVYISISLSNYLINKSFIRYIKI